MLTHTHKSLQNGCSHSVLCAIQIAHPLRVWLCLLCFVRVFSLQDLLFVDRYVQPSNHTCFNDVVHGSYGSFDATVIFQTLTPLAQTGDMHIAVTDFDANTIHIANASPMPNNSPAYNNGFVKFNSQALWTQKQPLLKEEHHAATISLF